MGAVYRDLHADRGVRMLMEAGVEAFEGVWDVGDPIKHLVGERAAVDDRRLADPDVPLQAVASPVRGGVA